MSSTKNLSPKAQRGKQIVKKIFLTGFLSGATAMSIVYAVISAW